MSETLCVGAAEHVRSAADVLDDAGICATVVPDGETARERVRRESVDCVVTALELPDQSGAELARRFDTAPTIVCAADGDEHVAAELLAGGAAGYVPAADVESALVDQVRAVLPDDSGGHGAEDEPAEDGPGKPAEDEPNERTPDRRAATADGSGGARTDPVESWNALFGAGTASAPPNYGFDAEDVAEFVDGDAAFVAPDASAEDDAPPPDQVRRAQTLEALHWATDDRFGDENATSIAERIVAAADGVLGVDLAAVFLTRAAQDGYEPIAARGASADDLPQVERTQSEESPAAGDAGDRGSPSVTVSPAAELPTASVEWYPIGERGLLCLGRDAAEGLDGWTAKLASLLASTGDAALDRAERERQLQRTAAVVEAAGDGVVAVDGANRIADLDDTFAGVTGYSRERLVGERLSLVVAEEARTRLESCLRELRSDGTPDHRSLAIDLQTRWSDAVRCELTLTAVPAAETDSRVVGVVRDVSQRRRLEDRLESCEETIREAHATALRLESARSPEDVYQAAVEGASDALDADCCRIVERTTIATGEAAPASEDDEFRVLAASGTAGRSDTVPQSSCADRLAAGALDDGQSRVEARFDAGACRPGDQVEPGTLAAAADDSEPVGRSGDDAGQYCSGLAVPIDESTALEVVAYEPAAFGDRQRELAELLVAHVALTLERLRYEADLRCQRDRIAALFDNVPNPIVRTRIENDLAIVEAVNPSFERVFGYDTDEIVGEVLDERIVPPERLERAQELTQRGLEGEIVETEVHRLTASGTRDFLLTVVPIADGDGNGVNYAIYTDITERKQRQQRLEVLNRVLRHDLRNGMNVVKGSAELLGDHVEGDAAAHVEAIDSRAAEMIDLADKTRTVQRTLQSDPGDVGPVDVVDAVQQAIDDLDVSVPGTEIETSLPAQAPARVGKLLPVAVRHVVENAIVHHDGEPTVEVSVREREDDHTVEVVVADDGPGIPEAERMLVTEQREITQLRHGSGLGLWIVNWVVTGSGGSLEIEHEQPRGTVVRMELPQAPADRCNLPVLLD